MHTRGRGRATGAALLALGASADVQAGEVPLGTWRTVVVPAAPLTQKAPFVTGALPPGADAKSAKPLVGPLHAFEGLASFYWQDQMTASGERFDKTAMTAAHRTLPMGTKVRVTHLASGRHVVVRINDRGPFKAGRVIDLSLAAAEQLQMTAAGLAQVRLDVVP
jgi:rare lipoprotein A